MVVFEDPEMEASDPEIELSSIKDISYDFLSQEELSYYLTTLITTFSASY